MKKHGLVALLAALMFTSVGCGLAACTKPADTSTDSTTSVDSGSSTDSGSSSGSETPAAEYQITVSATEHGTVTTNVSKAKAGAEITVTATPEANYVLRSGSLKCNGTEIEDGKFVMPAENVTITAEFVEDSITAIEVTAPDKDTYYLDEEASSLDLTGFEVIARYAGGGMKALETKDVTFSDVDFTAVNDNITVTVTYGTLTDTFQVGVRKRDVAEKDLANTYRFDKAANLKFEDTGVTKLVTLEGESVAFTANGGKIVVAKEALPYAQTILRVNKADGHRFIKVIAETHIKTVEDFKAIRDDLGGCYVLDASLNFEGAYIQPFGTVPVKYEGGSMIDSAGIGTSPDALAEGDKLKAQLGVPFTGTFDGNGYVLYNFKSGCDEGMWHAVNYGRSLFGYIGAGGTVKNVTLRGYKLEGGQDSAFIAGLNLGTVENIVIDEENTIFSHYGRANAIVSVNGGTVSNVVCYVSDFTDRDGTKQLKMIAPDHSKNEDAAKETATRGYIAPEAELTDLTALDGWKYIEGVGTVYTNQYYVISRAEKFEIPLGGTLDLNLWFDSSMSENVEISVWGNAEVLSGWNGERHTHYLHFGDGTLATEVGATFTVGFGTGSGRYSQWVTVAVTAPVLTGVTYDGEANVEWYKGVAVDKSQFMLTEHYSDGTTKSVQPDEIEGLDVESLSAQQVKLVYGTYSFDITVTVVEKVAAVASLELTGTAKNTVCYVGGTLTLADLAGLTLTAVYDDGSRLPVALTAEMLDKTTFTEADAAARLTISYEGAATTLTLTVYAAPTSITVALKEGVSSVVYPEGEVIDWSQFVTAADNNGNPVKFENLTFGSGTLNGPVTGKFVYTFNGNQTAETAAETEISFWYGIGTVDQWNNFAAKTNDAENPVTGYYTLTADIEFSGLTFVPAAGTPAETVGSAEFAGIFDGNGYQLKHITLGAHNSAVFIKLGGGGIVRNVGFYKFETKKSACAAIVKHNYGTVENCLVTGFYNMSGYGAGLVSNNTQWGVVRNCVIDKISYDSATNNSIFINENAGKVENCLVVNTKIDTMIRKDTGTSSNLVKADAWKTAEGTSILTYANNAYTYTTGDASVTFADSAWSLDETTSALKLVKEYL